MSFAKRELEHAEFLEDIDVLIEHGILTEDDEDDEELLAALRTPPWERTEDQQDLHDRHIDALAQAVIDLLAAQR